MILIAFSIACANAYSCELNKGDLIRPKAGYSFHIETKIEDKINFTKRKICISNSGMKTLATSWFIHKWDTWVPKNEVVWRDKNLDTKNIIEIDSCIEYGNLGETITARFFGDVGESNAAAVEKSIGCQAARDIYHQEASSGVSYPFDTAPTLTTQVRSFFPFDIERADETMVQLDGIVQIERRENDVARVSINLNVKKYDSAKEDYSGRFYVVPVDRKGAGSLYTNITKTYGDKIPLQKLVGFWIEYPVPSKNVSIGEALFDIYADSGEAVTNIAIPVYLQNEF